MDSATCKVTYIDSCVSNPRVSTYLQSTSSTSMLVVYAGSSDFDASNKISRSHVLCYATAQINQIMKERNRWTIHSIEHSGTRNRPLITLPLSKYSSSYFPLTHLFRLDCDVLYSLRGCRILFHQIARIEDDRWRFGYLYSGTYAERTDAIELRAASTSPEGLLYK